ncbi:MAG: S8 family peptidase [Anaerolineae bacterium]|jgi:serine protease AprX|nr:S8 family peptidase [Chloroflexota bacterium]
MARARKLSDELVVSMGRTAPNRQIPVIVRYSPNRVVMRAKGPALPGVSESYNYRLAPLAHMHATPQALQSLSRDPEIVRIYRDLPVRALMDTASRIVRVPEVLRMGVDGSGVRIAVIDTGVDLHHPDFHGRIAEAVDLVGEGPNDQNGHGTHCAGVALGSGIASAGRYRGIAPGALLYAAKALHRNGQGMMSDVMAGIEWAVEHKVQIISLSLGGPGSSDGHDALSDICDAAVAAGVVVVVAAGNDGPGSSTIGSPGAARRVITVGATDDTDTIASFSSRGPTADNRVKPDVVAPGHRIAAARARNTELGTPVDPYYTELSGTSMATPLVAGVCALILAREPGLSPEQVKARLMNTAIDLQQHPCLQGRGRVDALRAVWNDKGRAPSRPQPQPQPQKPAPQAPSGCLTSITASLRRALYRRRR